MTKYYGLSPRYIGTMPLGQFYDYFQAIPEIKKMGIDESQISNKEFVKMAKSLGLKTPQRY